MLQLRQLPANTPWMTEAKRLVTDFIDLLGSRDYSQLMRRMKIKEDELRQSSSWYKASTRAPARRSSPASLSTWCPTSSCARIATAGWWN